jgi:hypothetical protein
MTFLPCVISADYRGGFRIHLTFNDLSEGTVDFGRWLEGPVFEELKEPVCFRRFFIDGGTVVWPNGADIAPETLYEAAASTVARRTRQPPAKPDTRVKRQASRSPRVPTRAF